MNNIALSTKGVNRDGPKSEVKDKEEVHLEEVHCLAGRSLTGCTPGCCSRAETGHSSYHTPAGADNPGLHTAALAYMVQNIKSHITSSPYIALETTGSRLTQAMLNKRWTETPDVLPPMTLLSRPLSPLSSYFPVFP